MNHYFITPTTPGRSSSFEATIFGNELSFSSESGVFSARHLDLGTSQLLRAVDPPQAGRVLDLGCGVGTIAVGLAAASAAVQVDAVDVNDRAILATQRNAQRNGVSDRVRALRPEHVEASLTYDELWSNPPIRIGKDALHELLTTWLGRLKSGGAAYLVVGKNLGADSLQRWLIDAGYPTERLASAKGFRVFRAQA